MKKFLSAGWETLKMFIISLAIILPVRYFIAEPFYVKGASMEPNMHDHEYLVIDRLTYRYSNPKRGEIVVFRYPKNPQEYYIKRLIGLPGERIVVKNDHIKIYNEANPNGWQLPETYLPADLATIASNPLFADFQLKDNEYFMFGDNRMFSQDSRVFGPVNSSFFIGRVVFRGWPFDKFGLIEGARY